MNLQNNVTKSKLTTDQRPVVSSRRKLGLMVENGQDAWWRWAAARAEPKWIVFSEYMYSFASLQVQTNGLSQFRNQPLLSVSLFLLWPSILSVKKTRENFSKSKNQNYDLNAYKLLRRHNLVFGEEKNAPKASGTCVRVLLLSWWRMYIWTNAKECAYLI